MKNNLFMNIWIPAYCFKLCYVVIFVPSITDSILAGIDFSSVFKLGDCCSFLNSGSFLHSDVTKLTRCLQIDNVEM